MNKFALAVAASALMAMPSVASAATLFTTDATPNDTHITLSGGNYGTGGFGARFTSNEPSFSHIFNFGPITGGNLTSAVITFRLGNSDIDLTSILLDGVTAFTQISADPNAEAWQLASTFVGSGPHTLTIAGSAVAPSQYDGNLTISAVPEPMTWGMMVLGFGVIGGAMRSRRRSAGTVLA